MNIVFESDDLDGKISAIKFADAIIEACAGIKYLTDDFLREIVAHLSVYLKYNG